MRDEKKTLTAILKLFLSRGAFEIDKTSDQELAEAIDDSFALYEVREAVDILKNKLFIVRMPGEANWTIAPNGVMFLSENTKTNYLKTIPGSFQIDIDVDQWDGAFTEGKNFRLDKFLMGSEWVQPTVEGKRICVVLNPGTEHQTEIFSTDVIPTESKVHSIKFEWNPEEISLHYDGKLLQTLAQKDLRDH